MYEQMDISQYIYGIPMEQADFMMNEAHEVQYNETCMECKKSCKQSYKCQIVECPQFALMRKGRKRRANQKLTAAGGI